MLNHGHKSTVLKFVISHFFTPPPTWGTGTVWDIDDELAAVVCFSLPLLVFILN